MITIALNGYVQDWLAYLQKTIVDGFEDIEVQINSGGGYVTDGIGAYEFLRMKSEGRKIRTLVMANADSAASLVFMGGSDRVVMPNASIMIHSVGIDPFALSEVITSEDAQELADNLKAYDDRIANIYAAHTNISLPEILDMMGEETVITAADAVAKGFAHSMKIQPINFSNKMAESPRSLLERISAKVDTLLNSTTPAPEATETAVTEPVTNSSEAAIVALETAIAALTAKGEETDAVLASMVDTLGKFENAISRFSNAAEKDAQARSRFSKDAPAVTPSVAPTNNAPAVMQPMVSTKAAGAAYDALMASVKVK